MSSRARPSADAVRLGTKAVLVVGLFVALRVVVTVLPGLDRTVLVEGLVIRDMVTAALTLGVAVAVAYTGDRIESELAPSSDDVRADLANGLKFFVLFIALILAHDALAPVAAPFLTPSPGTWAFDLLFLALSLLALAVAVYRVGTNIDETTDLAVDRLLGSSGAVTGSGGESGAGAGSDGGTSSGGSDSGQTTCPDCGTTIDRDAAFCPDCGTDLRGA